MYRKRLQNPSLLDNPVPKLAYDKKSKRIKALPPPLVPTQYVPPQPVPKPRTQKSRRPVPTPRRPRDDRFFNVITPYYSDKAKSKFAKRSNFNVVITEKDRALKNYARSFEVSIVSKEDIDQQLFNTRSKVFELLESELSIDKGIKVEVNIKILLKKEDIDGNIIFDTPYFSSGILEIKNKYEIQIELDKADELIKERAAKWISKGSGWLIEEIQHHYVNIVKHMPLRGSSYLPLPEELRNSMYGLINLKNEDNKCAIWNLVRHRNPQKRNPQRITTSDYEFIKKLDLSGITFPITINQIPLIEKENNITINLFGYEEKKNFQFMSQKLSILIIWRCYILKVSIMVKRDNIMSISKILVD